MKRAMAAVVAGVSLMAFAGCGGSSSKTSSGPPASVANAPDIKSQLIQLSDLPAGWNVDNSNDSGGSTPACLKQITKSSNDAKEHVDASYQQGANGLPSLDEGINYGPGGVAAQQLTQLRQALQGCGQISFTDDGNKFSGTVGQLSFPHIGDDSSAYQIALSSQVKGLNVTFALDIVVFRKGDESVGLLYGDIGTPDIDQLQQLTMKAASKVI